MQNVPVEPNRQSRQALIGLGVVVVIAIVVAAILAVRQDVAQLDANSPEGVVQTYVQAVFDDDDLAAMMLLTSDLERECRQRDFPSFQTSAVRVDLTDTSITDNEARVEVTIHETSDPLSEWQHNEVFYLTNSADGWRISEPPWPLYGC